MCSHSNKSARLDMLHYPLTPAIKTYITKRTFKRDKPPLKIPTTAGA